MPKLTDTQIRLAKPRDRAYKIFDADGLYLQVNPQGGKWWRFKYRWEGREKLLSLGRNDLSRRAGIVGVGTAASRRSPAVAMTYPAERELWVARGSRGTDGMASQ